MYGNPEVTAGGNALKYYSSVRIDVRRTEPVSYTHLDVYKRQIITLKPPLPRLRVCAAHAPVLAHRVLRTLNHAKPQQVRFC